MYEEQEESSPGCEHTSDLSDGRLKWIDMFERHTHHHRVEGRFSVRELLRPCVHIASRSASGVSDADLRPYGVDPYRGGSEPGDAPGDLALPASDVKNSFRTPQVMYNEGKNLFFVLGVGSFGVGLLPPVRMLFPQRFADHRARITPVPRRADAGGHAMSPSTASLK